MQRKMLKILMAFCLVLCLAPAALAEPTTVVSFDVGGGPVVNENYAIEASRIVLNKKDTVIYELTGTTDKKISIWGSNDPADVDQAFYIRAKNVTLNGGIQVENSPVKMVLEVPEGTTNTIKKITANDLTVKGSGTLKAEIMSVTQKTSYMPSALHIQDTTIIVRNPANTFGEWNGPCVLSGKANVTYISGGKYASLQVGVKSNDKTHSLTLKDSARLYCLQDSDSPASSYVDGLEIFDNTPLVLQDNSYLEAKGKPSLGGAIFTQGSIRVEDSAEIKATAPGAAIDAYGAVTISGGKVTANSTGGNGIYSGETIAISNGATVEAAGYWPALFAESGVEILSSRVDASASNDVAIFSRGTVNVQNSVVKTQTPDGQDGILSRKTRSISGSWIETSGEESYDGDIQDSVLFNGDAGKVIGDALLPADAEIAKGRTLLIPKGASLRVGSGKTLVNNGFVTVEGEFANAGGTSICNSHFGGTADCQTPAVCSLCGVSYGAKNPNVHANLTHVDAKAANEDEEGNIEYWYCAKCGKYFSDAQAAREITREQTIIAKQAGVHANLTHVDAKAATAESAGNIEYWHCKKCGKYFSDAKAAHEITLEQTVIEKLPDKEAINNLPKTGDDSRVALWLLLLAVSGGVLLKNLADRRKNVD